jgi:GntR family transcriptional regulator
MDGIVNLKLKDTSSEPLQRQIFGQLRAHILGGKLPAGEAIPSIRALAKMTTVSVITVQRAYANLEREGLIHSRRGKGFYVSVIRNKARKKMAAKRLTENAEPLIRIANSEGLNGEEISTVLDELIRKINYR